MNTKKERALFAAALERHLEEENRMLEEYRNLSELVKGIPAGLLVYWIIGEEEVHNTILNTITNALRLPLEKKRGNGSSGAGMDRDKILRWTLRLRSKERVVSGGYRHLNSQVSWEEGNLFEVLIDEMIMNSERHRILLLAVEKMVRDE